MTETTDKTRRPPEGDRPPIRGTEQSVASSRSVARRRLAAGLLLGLAVAGLAFAFRKPGGSGPVASPSSTPSTVAPSPAGTEWKRPDDHKDFVGTRRCAECHREIAASFAAHPMGRSAEAVSAPAEFLKSHPPNDVLGDRWVYGVRTDGDILTHHEWMEDRAGETIYDVARTMAYAVGSGKRAIAFLHPVSGKPDATEGTGSAGGTLLRMSPLNWYSDAGKWDFAPGYTKSDPRRFDRRITDECLSCHVGRVDESGAGQNLYAGKPFHEVAIGCENCHGPGRAHVEAAATMGDGAKLRETIVNPDRLEPGRRDAVCYQCHLQAAARVPRRGRSDFDFRPGMELSDVWTHFDAGSDVAEDGKMRSVNQVQQMRESRCYLASEGRLGCVSCHDPHSVPEPSRKLAHYRDRCRSCHTPEKDCTEQGDRRQAVEDSCIACHMPTRGAQNVAHISLTDHRVLRRPEVAAASQPSELAETMLRFFDHSDRRLPADEQRRAIGLGLGQYFSRKGTLPPAELIQTLIESLGPVGQADGSGSSAGGSVSNEDGEVLVAIASMAQQRSDFATALAYFERASRVPGFTEPAFSGLMDLYALQERWGDVIAAGDRLLRIDPEDFRARALRGQALVATGKAAEGFQEVERALELHPSLLPLREWLIGAYRKADRSADADRHQAILDRLRDAGPPRE